MSCIKSPYQQACERLPRQFCDFINEKTTRFNEICKIYLDGLTIDDMAHMSASDYINLVPPSQYKHKLLMTIMVKRYIFCNDTDSCNGTDVILM